MDDAPVVLGVNRTQDASICLLHGAQLVWAIQKERLTRCKHHWGKPGDFRDLYRPRLPGLERPVDVLVECFSSDLETRQLPLYEAELAETLQFAPGCKRVRISHHLAHVYSVFHPSPFRDAAVMIVDGQGSPVAELTEHWSGAAGVPGDWREVSSFYRANRERVECIGKQVWNRDDTQLVGLGMFYFLLTQALFPGEGNEGKVMGLAPHGDAQALGLPPLQVDGAHVTIPAAWRTQLRERELFRYGTHGVRFSDCANLAAAGQRAFEDALLQVARWLHAATGLDNLCFAGGTGLNCSANQRLLRETPFKRVFIAPAPNDAGTGIGCALYGLTELAGRRCDWRWTNDYLGPAPRLADIEAALLDADDLIVERLPGRHALSERMLDVLCARKTVGLFQGRSEFGPRALGHRSIIGNPRHCYVRDWINAHVKQREWFRPLAPIVLEERAADYFDVGAPSPFMQYATPVHSEVAPLVPAITHVDGSARLQTVGPHDDALLRTLLMGFAARTAIPVLLNTSFNGKDEPIVETPFDAVAAFRRMPLHALAMPPFFVRKRVEPVLPGERLVLHVATDSRRFRVSFYRWGDGFVPMHQSEWLAGERAPARGPDEDWRWPPYEFAIPAHWPSAVYIAQLETAGGTAPAPALACNTGAALFVVRAQEPRGMLYKLPLATYHAYNASGGGCYYFNPPRSTDPPGARVSLLRPGGGIGGPTWGAPDYYDPASPRQSFAHWDARFIGWLARHGYTPQFCTDLDLHANPALLRHYRLLVSVGHDEYWTERSRDAVEDFVGAGGNAAFFAANLCWWRVHLVERDTAMVCHQGGPRGALDHWWPASGAGRPEDALSGVSYRHGGGWWDGPRTTVGYCVQQPEHWLFAGTGLQRGEAFGQHSRPPLVGYECDGAPLVAFDHATGAATLSPQACAAGTPEGYQLLAACPLDARWQERPPRERHGAGEGVHAATLGLFTRHGTVFSAGTTDWAQVLDSGQAPVVERITHNVLTRLLRG